LVSLQLVAVAQTGAEGGGSRTYGTTSGINFEEAIAFAALTKPGSSGDSTLVVVRDAVGDG
jgi:hypothetical protein